MFAHGSSLREPRTPLLRGGNSISSSCILHSQLWSGSGSLGLLLLCYSNITLFDFTVAMMAPFLVLVLSMVPQIKC